MTALEFIKDTIKFYSEDPSRRASINGVCCYKEPRSGNRCAVGRCMLDITPAERFHGPVYDLITHFGKEVLKPEYRDISVDVLRSCQIWHDYSIHFTTTGLTEIGQKRANFLIKKYS